MAPLVLVEGVKVLEFSLAQRLRRQTSDLAELLTHRIRELRGRDALTPCIRYQKPYDPGKSPLESGEYLAIGIDGSMDYDELLEMLLFYVCATGYRCPFKVDGGVRFSLEGVERDKYLEASASIPLWTEDLFQITEDAGSIEYHVGRSVERIPFAMMTMSELSLAVKAVEEEGVRLIFLDRPLSGTFGPLARDLRFFLRRGRSVLLGSQTKHGPLTLLDFRLASVLGSGNNWVPRRGFYLPYLVIQRLLGVEGLPRRELLKDLKLSGREEKLLIKRLLRIHESSGKGLLVDEDIEGEDALLALREDVKSYWLRIVEVISSIMDRLFKASEHPLMVDKGKAWLTVLDLNTVNAMLIELLREKALDRRVLVIGIAKDTSASEFLRAVIPYARMVKMIPREGFPNLKHDRAFLTIISTTNPHLYKTPWRTITYDSCFTTLVEGEDGLMLRAARKTISMERRFVRGYFQLREFMADEAIRSPTFLYDRFYDPRFDEAFTVEIEVMERNRRAEIYPYWEGVKENPLDSFILSLLSGCDNPQVLEALGHNQLLYLADKAVKTEVKMMKGLLRGVAELELGALSRRQKIFTIARRFRDIRRELEGAREKAASEGMERG